jgi:hypothetical protein
MSISFLGIPVVEGGGFTPYFVIENNAWQSVEERNNKVVNAPTWSLTSKQLGLPSNFQRATSRNRTATIDTSPGRDDLLHPRRTSSTRKSSRPHSNNQANLHKDEAPDVLSDDAPTRTVQVLKLDVGNVEIVNEVKITMYHKDSLRKKKKLFHFWIHTAFLDETTIFNKSELDGAHKDKKHRVS